PECAISDLRGKFRVPPVSIRLRRVVRAPESTPQASFHPGARRGSCLLSQWPKSEVSDRRYPKSVLSRCTEIRVHAGAPRLATVGFSAGSWPGATAVTLRFGRNTTSSPVEDQTLGV